jgi:sugar phosphate isomerase/epimerase
METKSRLILIFTAVFIMTSFYTKDKFHPEIGVCTLPSNSVMLKEAGYDYLETGVAEILMPNSPEDKFEEKLKIIKDAGFKIYACNGFLPAILKSVGPEANHDSILRYAEITFRRAKKSGIKTIVFGSGDSRRAPEGFDKQKAVQQFIDLLKKISPIAAKYDIVISIEVLNSPSTNIINHISEGLEVAKAVNHPNCKILVDFYHMVTEGDAPEEILKCEGYIYHCHIGEKEKRTAPGMMGDDFRPYFRALRKINYKGNITIEASLGDDMKKQLPLSLAEMKKQIAESK